MERLTRRLKALWVWWVGEPAFEEISEETKALYEVSEGPR